MKSATARSATLTSSSSSSLDQEDIRGISWSDSYVATCSLLVTGEGNIKTHTEPPAPTASIANKDDERKAKGEQRRIAGFAEAHVDEAARALAEKEELDRLDAAYEALQSGLAKLKARNIPAVNPAETKKLDGLTAKWKAAAQGVLWDLLPLMKDNYAASGGGGGGGGRYRHDDHENLDGEEEEEEDGGDFDMTAMLKMFKLEAEMVGWDPKTETFK